MVALLLLPYRCLVTVNVLWLFLAVPWVGMLCVIVVLSIHTHLIFKYNAKKDFKKNPAVKFLDLIFRNNFFIFNFSKMCSR